MGGAPNRMNNDGRHIGLESSQREVGWIGAVATRGELDRSGDDERRAGLEQR
jgi:hypothetical protein